MIDESVLERKIQAYCSHIIQYERIRNNHQILHVVVDNHASKFYQQIKVDASKSKFDRKFSINHAEVRQLKYLSFQKWSLSIHLGLFASLLIEYAVIFVLISVHDHLFKGDNRPHHHIDDKLY